MPLKSWSVTCIEFEEGDLFSFVVAFSQLAPVFVCVSLATLCAFQRDLRVAVFFVGQLFDAAFNQVVKRIIKQPRPHGITNGTAYAHAPPHTHTQLTARSVCTASLRTDYGMPSNHSEFILFFSTYAALVVLFRYRVCVSLIASISSSCVSVDQLTIGAGVSSSTSSGRHRSSRACI
jgi:dolichyldiphosphatase